MALALKKSLPIFQILEPFMGKRQIFFLPEQLEFFLTLIKIGFGPQHFSALNRKFNLNLLNRSDLIPLTREAKEIP